MHTDLPVGVVSAAVGAPARRILSATTTPITGSTGVATGRLERISGIVEGEDGLARPYSVVRKEVRPLDTGPHASGTNDPAHWTYWRREPLVYEAGLVAAGPGLSAPRCFGVDGAVIFLEDVTGGSPDPSRAASLLAGWQAVTEIPNVPWLAAHQLEQRVRVTNLDWSTVAADPRAEKLWLRRDDWLERLRGLPLVVSHGDFHLDNLVGRDDEIVALDWQTFGVSPVGADLAHLAISAGRDLLEDYLAAGAISIDADDVREGYRCALALTGASRVHWMLSFGLPVPDGYVDFVWANRPTCR